MTSPCSGNGLGNHSVRINLEIGPHRDDRAGSRRPFAFAEARTQYQHIARRVIKSEHHLPSTACKVSCGDWIRAGEVE
jgi:hypothetical protein